MVFKTLTPLVLAPLSVFICSLALSKQNPEVTSLQKDNDQSHRSKRWIWGGCGLIPSCDRCSDGLICKQCSRVFLPVEYLRGGMRMIRCVRACPEGYNISSTLEYPKICVRVQLGCTVRNCDVCHPLNPVSCTNCSSAFYSLQKRIMGVVKCVRQCPIGYTPFVRHDGRKMCKDSQIKCQATVPHCAKCLDSQRCQKCKSNFLAFLNKTSMICLRSCPAGFIEADTVFFGRYCKKPREVCKSVRNCERCPDLVNCRRCKPNYFKIKLLAFSNATCVSHCPPGFQVKGRRCQRILEDGCFDEYCLTCKVGWYHNKKHCLRQCPAGYYARGLQQKFCSRCPQNCESCSNNHDCIKCQPGTSRMVEGSRVACLQNCPSGYSSQGDDKTGHVCLPHRIT